VILGAETITRRRQAAGTRGSDGRYTPGATTDTTIQASVQPFAADELAVLPEGERHREPRKVYTTSDLRTGDQHLGTPADRLVIDSVVFEVVAVERHRSVIPHYKARAVRLQEAA
jgi:hypothetical protein